MWFMHNAMSNPDNAGAGASDYMRLFGLVALGYMWARIAKAALARGAASDESGDPMEAKLLTGRFFMEQMLPETATLAGRVAAGSQTMMALPAEMF
jgi:hypothetical protein